MLTTGDTTIDENILDSFGRERKYTTSKVEYYDGSSWREYEDVKAFSFDYNTKENSYNQYAFVGRMGGFSMSLDNARRVYSPTIGALSSSVSRGVKVRVRIGYTKGSESTSTYNAIDLSTSVYKYNSRYSDSVESYPTSDTFIDFEADGEQIFLPRYFYDSLDYDEATYSLDGYYVSSLIEVGDRDNYTEGFRFASSGSVDVYYRLYNPNEIVEKDFTFLASVNTTKEVDFTVKKKKYIQFYFLFKSGLYETSIQVEEKVKDRVGFITAGTYTIASVSYSVDNESKNISVKGENGFSKIDGEAYESGLNTLSNSAQLLNQIKNIFSQVNCFFDEASSDAVPIVSLTPNESRKSAKEIIDDYLVYINAVNAGTYQIRASTSEADTFVLKKVDVDGGGYDYIFTDKKDLYSVSYDTIDEEPLESIFIASGDYEFNADTTETISYASGYDGTIVEDATLTFSSDLYNIFLGGGYNVKIKSIDSGGITYDYVKGNAFLEITGDTLLSGTAWERVNPDIYSIPFDATSSGVVGSADITKAVGDKLKVEDSATATTLADIKEMTDLYIDTYTTGIYKASVKADTLQLAEAGDIVYIADYHTAISRLFTLEKIKTSYSSDGAKISTTYKLADSGVNFDELIYDRDLEGSLSILYYDTRLYWDLDIWSESDDTRNYKNVSLAN